jgi:uncharacterized repeat protein (TIGR03803 family)
MPTKKRARLSFAARVVVVFVIAVTAVMAQGAASAIKYKVLHRFTNGADGGFPRASMIFDSTGGLYGTTEAGGVYNFGTVFKLTANEDGRWTESVLHSFNGDGKDGVFPVAGLILDHAGDVYGTTTFGGSYGYGTVFQLSPSGDGSWTESVLYSFNNDRQDGYEPWAGLIFDAAGNLYGTTYYGGTGGSGTVFELSRNGDGGWTESVLHSFDAHGVDGYEPAAGLVFDRVGNLYGTTLYGGTNGAGNVFKLTANGDGSWRESVLHTFSETDKEGFWPSASLVFDAAGSLYGTTLGGGRYGPGTIFQLTPEGQGWKEKVLHSFDFRDGVNPSASVVLDQAGNLYTTTLFGGVLSCYHPDGCGVVFRMQPTTKGGWRGNVLHFFWDDPGALPSAGLVLDGQGHLYGTTGGDGVRNWGAVFEITP